MVREAEWVDFRPGVFSRPECEVVGWDGHHIYAFRTQYAGGIRPGKARESAFICYGEKEFQITTGQLLKKGNYEWVFTTDGHLPPNAVVCGNGPEGAPYYLGRAIINRTLTPGLVAPHHGCLYIPYAGKTNRVTEYTVLCFKDVDCPPPQYDKPKCPPPVISSNTCSHSTPSTGDYGYLS